MKENAMDIIYMFRNDIPCISHHFEYKNRILELWNDHLLQHSVYLFRFFFFTQIIAVIQNKICVMEKFCEIWSVVYRPYTQIERWLNFALIVFSGHDYYFIFLI